MTIHEILRKQRLAKNLTQQDVANTLGLDSVQFVSLMERGLASVPYKTLGKLIGYLDLDEKTLMRILMQDFKDELITKINEGKKAATKTRDI